MSINWVMLSPSKSYTPLPSEKPLLSSPRISLSISTPRTYPANSPLSITSSTGTLYLTTQRLIYLPSTPTQAFQSFSAPILNLHDTHITVPWFGPNIWSAVVQPVRGGGMGEGHAVVELKLTFKEGGAVEFQGVFERIKERVGQAVEVARESGGSGGRGMANGVDLTSVHLDQLPSYEEAGGHERVATRDGDVPVEVGDLLDQHQPEEREEIAVSERSGVGPGEAELGRTEQPSDAPPGYEETQRQSIQLELERRLSDPTTTERT